MVRFAIVGIVIAVAFTLYALVDAAMIDRSRARGIGKPAWVVLIVAMPVLGGALWFLFGRGRGLPPRRQQAPDDDPRFTGRRMSNEDLDAHMRDLEDQLRALDEETYPGEAGERRASENAGGADGAAGATNTDDGEGSIDVESNEGPEAAGEDNATGPDATDPDPNTDQRPE